tara:strand:- start:154 stop:591 length:438 start_codon:yes stop_codon:yes gene_type:complete
LELEELVLTLVLQEEQAEIIQFFHQLHQLVVVAEEVPLDQLTQEQQVVLVEDLEKQVVVEQETLLQLILLKVIQVVIVTVQQVVEVVELLLQEVQIQAQQVVLVEQGHQIQSQAQMFRTLVVVEVVDNMEALEDQEVQVVVALGE